LSQTTTLNNISFLGGTADVTISSTLKNAGAKAETKLSGGSGASVSIVGIDLNFAVATSKTVNTATISGGTIDVKSLSMNSSTKSQVTAFGKTPTAVGLVLLGALLTDARTADRVTATASNANITTANDLDITAVGDGTADAMSENGMKVSLVSGTSSRASAQVGAGSGDRQSVTAGISGGTVNVGGSLDVSAENTGSAKANIKSGLELGLATVSVSVLPTTSYYKTEAYVKGGANVTTGRDLTVRTQDYTKAESRANSNSIGLGLSADDTKGTNTIVTDSAIDIGGVLKAGNNLNIQINSITSMDARTVSTGGGFIKGSGLRAENYLTRTGKISVAADSALAANFGDVNILSVLGRSYDGKKTDSISTYAKSVGGGVVTLSTIRNDTSISNTAQIDVNNGVSIFNRYNNINIRTDSSQNGLSVYGSADASGLGAAPDVKNDVRLTLNSVINLGQGGSKVEIEGRRVYVGARIAELSENVYAYAKGAAVGADVDATNNTTHHINATTNVSSVTMIAHDDAKLYASTAPAYKKENIRSESRVQLNAIGEAIAKTDMRDSYAKPP
jgi:hypothetical protein